MEDRESPVSSPERPGSETTADAIASADTIAPDAVDWEFRADEDATPALRDIADRLQLFFDDWLIDRMEGAQLRLHSPPLLHLNKPPPRHLHRHPQHRLMVMVNR